MASRTRPTRMLGAMAIWRHARDIIGAHEEDLLFAVPLELSPTYNRAKLLHWAQAFQIKRKCYEYIRTQSTWQVYTTLAERAELELFRGSSARSIDADASWDKYIVDALRPHATEVRRGKAFTQWGIGAIADDSPAHVTRVYRRIKTAPSQGFTAVIVRPR